MTQRVGERLTWISSTEHLHRSGHLFLGDPFVLLFLGGCLQPLPGEVPQVEVHQHVAQGLQVVSAALLCRRR